MEKYKNFINNKWIESDSKETIKVDDPSNGKIIGEISCAKKNEVDLAVEAAKNSYNSRVLVDMPLLSRAKLMRKIAEETRKVSKEGKFEDDNFDENEQKHFEASQKQQRSTTWHKG